jgi:hypothetical protein
VQRFISQRKSRNSSAHDVQRPDQLYVHIVVAGE